MPKNNDKDFVYAYDQYGEPTYVHRDDAEAAAAQGYEIKTRFDEKVDAFVENNKGVRGGAKVFMGQMADEAALGIPELVYDKTKSPLEIAQKEALKKYHAGWNAAGGLTGAIGSFGVGGPLFKGASKLGEATTAGVSKMLGVKAAEEVSKTTVKKIAKDVVAKSVGTGVEGVTLASPYAFSEAVLGDPDDAAETLAFGLGLGGVFGGVSAMGSGLAKLAKESSVAEEARRKISTLIKDNKDLRAIAEDKAVEALNPNLGQRERLRALEEVIEDGGAVTLKPTDNLKAIGRDLLDNDIITALGTKQDMYDRLAVKTKDLRKNVGDMFDSLDDRFKTDVAIDTGELITSIRKSVRDNDYFKTSAFKPYRERVEKYLTNLEEVGPLISLRQANREKAAFQKIAESAYKSLDAGIDVNSAQIIAEIPKEINKLMRAKIKDADPKMLSELIENQRLLGNLSQAENIARKSAAREARNNDFGLTSIITGSGGVGAGAMLGGPLGAIAGGLIGLMGREVSRKYGDQIVATALNKHGGMLLSEQAMKRAANKLDLIPETLKRMRDRLPPKRTMAVDTLNRMFRIDHSKDERVPDRKVKYDQIKKVDEKLGEWVSNPIKASSDVANITASISNEGAPNIASSLNTKLIGAANYLHSQIPRPPAPKNPFEKPSPWKPSDYDMNQFMSKAEVVDDPFVVVQRLEDGSLSRAHMEALKNVYPGMHRYMVDKIQATALKEDVQLSYNQRLKLSLLIDAPLDSSLSNESVAYFQDGYVKGEEGAKSIEAKQAFSADIDIAGNMRTDQEKLLS